jgi:hypothetical protein
MPNIDRRTSIELDWVIRADKDLETSLRETDTRHGITHRVVSKHGPAGAVVEWTGTPEQLEALLRDGYAQNQAEIDLYMGRTL